jgi:ubiquitin C-terminal hydrolase
MDTLPESSLMKLKWYTILKNTANKIIKKNSGKILSLNHRENIVEAYRDFCQTEKINDWTDPVSGISTGITKRCVVYSWPDILIVAIRRYSASLTKLTGNTIIPIFWSIKNKKKNDDDTTIVYRMVACVVHIGSLSCGHYVTIIRSRENGFYMCDDATTEKIPTERALSLIKKSYLVFYERV